MNYWLAKSEPSVFSYADLESRSREPWDGVRNFTAAKHLRAWQPGDRIFIYHSGDERAVIGVAEVISPPYPDPTATDPRWVAVDVRPLYRLRQPVTLRQIKQNPDFAAWELLRQSRLSVMPVTPEHWQKVHALGSTSPAE